MSKDEFLQGLQNALSGEVPPDTVRENLRYYDGYMRAERQKGRTEAEILEELGDPRLIARTIIDTTPGAGAGGFPEYRGGIFTDGARSGSSYAEYTGEAARPYGQDAGQNADQNGNIRYYDLNKWYWKLLGAVVIIGILSLVFLVISGILSLLVPLLPILVMTAVIMWFVRGPHR